MILLFVALTPVLFILCDPGITGTLLIDPSYGNILYIQEYDIDIRGMDRNGVTYFCLPSFINLTAVDMEGSPLKIYLEDGSVLADTLIGEPQDVNVETPDGSLIPWKIEFMRSANLNSVFLRLGEEDVSDIEKDRFSPADVKIYSPTGALRLADEEAFIKGRGNATWTTEYFEPEKKPYELAFSGDVRIGQLYPRKKWTLLANTYDGTDILNKMILDTARSMDMKYVSDSEWIDLYANGSYLGNYLVCSEPADSVSPVTDSGGWLIEKNDTYYDDKSYGFTTSQDAFSIRAPAEIRPRTVSMIHSFIGSLDRSLHENSNSPYEYIDMDSFVRWFMLEEVFYNEDALITSCYFYNSGMDDILYAGPPWDFDNACGEGGKRFLDYRGSILNEPEDRHPLDWYNILYDDPVFRARLSELFAGYAPLFEDLVTRGIDDYYEKAGASIRMDRAVYGVKGYGQDYTVPGYYMTAQNNFRYTKYFLCNRLRYLSEKWRCGVSFPEPDLGDGTEHTLTFIFPDSGSKQVTIKDGDIIEDTAVPQYDPLLYDGWIYEENGLDISPFIPVYEDCCFVLKAKQEDDP